jgi:hypothetical protein
MLQTAVHPLQEFHQVKATTALLKVHTKKDLDYAADVSFYCQLLLIMIVSMLLAKERGKNICT